jgi:glycolate oxidase iron-sulfur subunit
VRVQPRTLLQGIPGVEVRDVPEPEICCGSAGIYNMLEPQAATQLRDRKVANIMSTNPDAIVSSNPGCLLQIATGFDKAGRHVPVMHMIELLDRSIALGRSQSPVSESRTTRHIAEPAARR